jgi:hypothetical protein
VIVEKILENEIANDPEASMRTEDGARYRVRTCDPYRVKVMLYH